jgi:cytochrome d ubiquinol oxidase subunit II
MGADLSLIWAIIILFGIMMYIVMDGFDLGIGILYPFFPDKTSRDIMMNTIAPVWDGNETWLVLGGAGLLAAFPLAYSIILSAFYMPIILMLLGLILRGVAFEFRFKANESEQHFWDKAFIVGSITATAFQGVILGAYLQGIPVQNGIYSGGPFNWLTPFSVFTALGLLVTYALLGSTWLIMKTSGLLQITNYYAARVLAFILLLTIIGVSIWTPFIDNQIFQRWFTMPNILWLSPIPMLVAALFYMLQKTLSLKKANFSPFIYSLGLVFLGYLGLGISIWPNIVPPNISIHSAAAPHSSQSFALVGAIIIIPLILAYTAWGYYVFRGKVSKDDHYH